MTTTSPIKTAAVSPLKPIAAGILKRTIRKTFLNHLELHPPSPLSWLTWTRFAEPNPASPSHQSPDTSIWPINESTGPDTHTDCYTNWSGTLCCETTVLLAERFTSNQWTCSRPTDDTLGRRTCLLSRDTLKKQLFFFLFFGSIIFSLRYTVPISGLWMWFVVFVLRVWIIEKKYFPPLFCCKAPKKQTYFWQIFLRFCFFRSPHAWTRDGPGSANGKNN